jgi:hypothetical protein
VLHLTIKLNCEQIIITFKTLSVRHIIFNHSHVQL